MTSSLNVHLTRSRFKLKETSRIARLIFFLLQAPTLESSEKLSHRNDYLESPSCVLSFLLTFLVLIRIGFGFTLAIHQS